MVSHSRCMRRNMVEDEKNVVFFHNIMIYNILSPVKNPDTTDNTSVTANAINWYKAWVLAVRSPCKK